MPNDHISGDLIATLSGGASTEPLRGYLSARNDHGPASVTKVQSLDTPAPLYSLTLHIVNGHQRSFKELRSNDLDTLFDLSAQAIMEEFDGYVLASYLELKSQHLSDPIWGKAL